jgi:hypothetical protein
MPKRYIPMNYMSLRRIPITSAALAAEFGLGTADTVCLHWASS